MHLAPCKVGATVPFTKHPEVADILRRHLEGRGPRLAVTFEQARVARDIIRCRTPILGGHLQCCQACGLQRPAYNSCTNRHCPKCLALAQARWIARRLVRTLPTHHFHVVFTFPQGLALLARTNRPELLDLLIRSAAASLLTLGRDPRWLGVPAQLGVTTVLHTWTRDLRWHPHVHCVVTGGGLALDQTRLGFGAAEFPVSGARSTRSI